MTDPAFFEKVYFNPDDSVSAQTDRALGRVYRDRQL